MFDHFDVGRNNRLYGALFDVNNWSRLEPLTTRRGLPTDLSASLRNEVLEDDGQPWGIVSWLEAGELLAHEWSDVTSWARRRLEVYWIEQDGSMVPRGRDHQPSLLDESELRTLLLTGAHIHGNWQYRCHREFISLKVGSDFLRVVDRLRVEVAGGREARLVAQFS